MFRHILVVQILNDHYFLILQMCCVMKGYRPTLYEANKAASDWSYYLINSYEKFTELLNSTIVESKTPPISASSAVPKKRRL